MASEIAQFAIEPRDGRYLLKFEAEDGETLEVIATYDQLDLIADEIDTILDEDEADALAPDAKDEAEE